MRHCKAGVFGLALRFGGCYIFRAMETKVAVPIAARTPEQAHQQVRAALAAGLNLPSEAGWMKGRDNPISRAPKEVEVP